MASASSIVSEKSVCKPVYVRYKSHCKILVIAGNIVEC